MGETAFGTNRRPVRAFPGRRAALGMVSPLTLLRTLPLPPSVLALFAAADFDTVGDLDGLTAAGLAEELSSAQAAMQQPMQQPMDAEQAAKLLLMARTGGLGDEPCASSSSIAPSCSALALLHEERSSRRVITFSRDLDALLGGGIAQKQLTEFAGTPGVGKTQLAMQLALNVQIPPSFGGLGARSAYIDAEGSFIAQRCLEMAEGLVRFLRAAASTAQQRADADALQARAMLERIVVYRVHDHVEQLAAIRAVGDLPREEAEAARVASVLGGHGFLSAADGRSLAGGDSEQAALPPVKLVVVDSIAFHLRHVDVSYASRQAMAGKMAQALCSLAGRGTDGTGLACVVINQVTTKVNDAVGTSSLVPALGETWAHVCNVQLILSWRDGMRVATLYKGGTPGEAVYVVTGEGIRSRDAPVPQPRGLQQQQQQQQQQHHTAPAPAAPAAAPAPAPAAAAPAPAPAAAAPAPAPAAPAAAPAGASAGHAAPSAGSSAGFVGTASRPPARSSGDPRASLWHQTATGRHGHCANSPATGATIRAAFSL